MSYDRKDPADDDRLEQMSEEELDVDAFLNPAHVSALPNPIISEAEIRKQDEEAAFAASLSSFSSNPASSVETASSLLEAKAAIRQRNEEAASQSSSNPVCTDTASQILHAKAAIRQRNREDLTTTSNHIFDAADESSILGAKSAIRQRNREGGDYGVVRDVVEEGGSTGTTTPFLEPPLSQISTGAFRVGNSHNPRDSMVSMEDVPEEEEGGDSGLPSALVLDEDALRNQLLRDAVQAQVVDEDIERRKQRRRLGLLIAFSISFTSAILAVSIASVRRQQSITPLPSAAPTVPPTLAPTTIDRNDYCNQARELYGGESFVDNLGSNQSDVTSISCLEDTESNGRWYSYRGTGLIVTVDLRSPSGRIEIPLLLTGRCGGLECQNPIAYQTNLECGDPLAEAGCSHHDTVSWLTIEEESYWFYVHSHSDWYEDDLRYAINFTTNDDFLGAYQMHSNTMTTLQWIGSTQSASMKTFHSCYLDEEVSSAGVWFSLTGNGTFVSLDTCDRDSFKTMISIFTGEMSNLSCTDARYGTCGSQTTVEWFAESSVEYHILLSGSSLQSRGSYVLTKREAPGYSECSRAEHITSTNSEAQGSTSDGEFPRGQFSQCQSQRLYRSPGVWYRLQGTGEPVSTRCSAFTC